MNSNLNRRLKLNFLVHNDTKFEFKAKLRHVTISFFFILRANLKKFKKILLQIFFI